MIYLYTGTPGSGKSLDTARLIKARLWQKKPVICNFPISENVKNYEYFTYKRNDELTVEFLTNFAKEHFGKGRVKEGALILIIDEAQMIFNSRDWAKSDRQGWNTFFQIHRHFGYDVFLSTQFDKMLDRQIRSLVEYEVIHRKVNNYGWRGKILQLFFLAPTLFVRVKYWYPMKEKVDSNFFRGSKRLYRLYDTYALSFLDEEKADAEEKTEETQSEEEKEEEEVESDTIVDE